MRKARQDAATRKFWRLGSGQSRKQPFVLGHEILDGKLLDRPFLITVSERLLAEHRLAAVATSRLQNSVVAFVGTICSSPASPSNSATPSARQATTGFPAAIASRMTFGIPSQCEGRTSRSAAARICGISGRQPAK